LSGISRDGYGKGSYEFSREAGFVVVHIGARGKLSRRDAKHAAALWRQLQREAPQAHFKVAIAGYDEDPRPLWEISEAAAYVRTWARLAGLTDPEAAERAFRPWDDYSRGATVGLLDLCCVFGDKPLFTQPETAH
jgi:hypothetical protein